MFRAEIRAVLQDEPSPKIKKNRFPLDDSNTVWLHRTFSTAPAPHKFPPQSWSTTIKPVWEAGEVWNFHFSTGLGMLWGEGEELSLLQVSNDVSSVRCCLPLTGDVAGHELPVLTFQALHRLMFQMLFQRHYKEEPPTCEQGDQWTGSFSGLYTWLILMFQDWGLNRWQLFESDWANCS